MEIQRRHYKFWASAIGVLFLSQAWVAQASSCQPERGFCRTEAVATTGNNNIRGKTVYSFDRNGAHTFGQFIAEWNPHGILPFPIDENTPDDAILATVAPPGFPLYGANAPDIPYQNLRFQDVPTFVTLFGDLGTIPSIEDVSPLGNSFGSKKTNYTLGQWLEASGTMILQCRKDGSTRVQARFKNLVRNGGLYTLWGVWALPSGQVFPFPLGGAGTNAFATDSRGRADLDLEIPHCMLDEHEGSILVGVQVDFHSDDGILGPFPNLPFVDGRGPGIIGHAHMMFLVRGELCENVGNCDFVP